ncbi:hypothetical protein J6590_059026 [Homalodisca vitripennis]|nr:hypothetical protein J6590_059026 [Homalodisca vitripennis]
MKKYYVIQSTTTAESNTFTDKLSNVAGNIGTTSSSMPNLPTQCSELQPSSPQPSTSTSTLPESSNLSFTIEPAIIRDLEEKVALTVNDKNFLSDDTYTSVKKSSLCPETIKKSPHLCTGVAYDNFDRFVETKSGKDTLHDTVGFVYQNFDLDIPYESELLDVSSVNSEENLHSKKRKRRTFEAVSLKEVSYPQKTKDDRSSGVISP